MSHNLEEINAALRLGDHPYPPVGVVIEVEGNDRERERGLVLSLEDIKTRLIHQFLDEGDLVLGNDEGQSRIWSMKPETLKRCGYQVVSIPPTAPPFSEWERSVEPC